MSDLHEMATFLSSVVSPFVLGIYIFELIEFILNEVICVNAVPRHQKRLKSIEKRRWTVLGGIDL
jgi:hypothetical protein